MMPLRDLPDKDLLDRCRLDCQQAYAVLFQRYFRSIYTYALKFTRKSVIAEELAMDVMLRLWNKRAELDVHIHLSGYLFRGIKNALVDHWRKKEMITVEIEELTLQASPADWADAHLRREELQQWYNQSLDGLPVQCREVFRLSREQELSYLEIAQKLDISVHTVKYHIMSGLKSIRLKMGPVAELPLVWTLVLSLLF